VRARARSHTPSLTTTRPWGAVVLQISSPLAQIHCDIEAVSRPPFPEAPRVRSSLDRMGHQANVWMET
jgi:hypothetical protein